MRLHHRAPTPTPVLRRRRAGELPALALVLGTVVLAATATAGCARPEEAQKPKAEPAAEAAAETAAEPGAAEPAAAEAPSPSQAPAPRPGQGAPLAPAPAPALNRYAESCLVEAPPEAADEMRAFTAGCLEHLLETVRAAVGVAGLSQEAMGAPLRDAEDAVRSFSLEPHAPDAADRARAAAFGVAELLEAVAAADPGAELGDLDALRAAAVDLDAGRPLVEQRGVVAGFLHRADAAVRPLVRALSRPPGDG